MQRTREVTRADLATLYADPANLVPDAFVDAWSSEETQATMHALVARLKEKG